MLARLAPWLLLSGLIHAVGLAGLPARGPGRAGTRGAVPALSVYLVSRAAGVRAERGEGAPPARPTAGGEPPPRPVGPAAVSPDRPRIAGGAPARSASVRPARHAASSAGTKEARRDLADRPRTGSGVPATRRAPAQVLGAGGQGGPEPSARAGRSHGPGGEAPEPAVDAVSAARPRYELLDLLQASIERHRRYPIGARRRHREGTVRVGFALHPDGRIDAVRLARSSGSRPLDRAALAAVEAVDSLPRARAYLRAPARFQVDVIFELH